MHISSANRAMFSTMNKCYKLKLPLDLELDLFDKIVQPTLLYGCEIWGSSNAERLEIFSRNFLRRCLKLGKSTNICMLYGETGRRYLQCSIDKRMLNYWLKIVVERDEKITNRLYKYILSLHNSKQYTSKWLSKVKSILDNCGMSHVWINQNALLNTDIISKTIDQRIDDMWVQWWHSYVETRSQVTG